jgi:hypothetical protein
MSSGRSCQCLAAKATSRALIVSQASSAAMPLRSEPEEAAVAEVLGTFPVVVAVILIWSSPMPKAAPPPAPP